MTFAPDEPLRLSVAAKAAFPDGSMTASGLRREAGRERLVIERIAGKDYTTLAAIERMRELCRVEQKGHASTSNPPAEKRPQSGSSATGQSNEALDSARAKLALLRAPKTPSKITSPARQPRATATVTRLQSRSHP